MHDLDIGTFRLIRDGILSRLPELDNLEFALTYADSMDYDLAFEYGFIEEMSRRGLTFEDLEEIVTDYYSDTASL